MVCSVEARVAVPRTDEEQTMAADASNLGTCSGDEGALDAPFWKLLHVAKHNFSPWKSCYVHTEHHFDAEIHAFAPPFVV